MINEKCSHKIAKYCDLLFKKKRLSFHLIKFEEVIFKRFHLIQSRLRMVMNLFGINFWWMGTGGKGNFPASEVLGGLYGRLSLTLMKANAVALIAQAECKISAAELLLDGLPICVV